MSDGSKGSSEPDSGDGTFTTTQMHFISLGRPPDVLLIQQECEASPEKEQQGKSPCITVSERTCTCILEGQPISFMTCFGRIVTDTRCDISVLTIITTELSICS